MYATGKQLTERYDIDWIGEMASDDRSTLAQAEVPQHPAVITALAGASGRVNSALIVGAKYTPDQLVGLEGTDDGEYLADLVCNLAIIKLCRRRPEATPVDMIGDLRDETETQLELLRKGANIFNLEANVEATLVDTDGPTAVELIQRNGLGVRMRRFFPEPAQRLPLAQGGIIRRDEVNKDQTGSENS